MDIADLRIFEAVARLGSMNRAAQELNTVQSNVTARIRALETELGLPLFHRHPRGVSTTPAGQRLLPFAPRLAKMLDDARAAARDDGRPMGPLHIGGLETTTALRLSPVLADFARLHPAVRLIVTTGTTRKLIEDVLACRLDAAFVAGPLSHPDLDQTPVITEELILATAPNIRTGEALRACTDLRTIVFQSGCSYRQRLEAHLAQLGLVTAEPLEFGSLEAIISSVSAGVGVTLLPRAILASAAREGRIALHDLPRGAARVETLMIQRRDAYASSALTAFRDRVRAHYLESRDAA